MPKIPGINHLRAVRALEKGGFRIVRQGKHIVMSDGSHFITIPRHNPVNALTMGETRSLPRSLAPTPRRLPSMSLIPQLPLNLFVPNCSVAYPGDFTDHSQLPRAQRQLPSALPSTRAICNSSASTAHSLLPSGRIGTLIAESYHTALPRSTSIIVSHQLHCRN